MGAIHVSRHVNAPPEITFSTATDFARLADFVPGINRVELLTEGAIGAGARFAETRAIFGREATEEMTVSSWDPPHRVVLEAVSCGCLIQCEHQFKPDIAGTLVEFRMTPRPEGFGAKAMMILMAPVSWMMSRTMRKMVDADLDALKAEAERRATIAEGGAADQPRRGYELRDA